MAKQQDLPLSPMEISGVCGRLLCCLSYENDYYGEIKKLLPRVGRTVVTAHGEGKVVSVNVLTESVTVQLPGEMTVMVGIDELDGSSKQDTGSSGKRRRRNRR
jgi:cell fate regulator YaaT (PSP1 superfamily)